MAIRAGGDARAPRGARKIRTIGGCRAFAKKFGRTRGGQNWLAALESDRGRKLVSALVYARLIPARRFCGQLRQDSR